MILKGLNALCSIQTETLPKIVRRVCSSHSEKIHLKIALGFDLTMGTTLQGEIQRRSDEILHDIVLVPLKKIDQQMQKFQHSLFPEAILTLGSLSSAILLSGISLTNYAYLAVAGAVASGTMTFQSYRATQDRKEQLKQLPAFFYWKATTRGRNRMKK